MRIATTYIPGPGHLNTVACVHEALVRSGHDAVLCGSRTIAARSGLPLDAGHCPVGFEEYPRSMAEVPGTDEVGTLGTAGSVSLKAYRDMRDLFEGWRPDLIVRDTSDRGAVLAAEALRIPFVSVVTCGDAALTALRASEAERLAELRGHLGTADRFAALDRGTVAFGPEGFYGSTTEKYDVEYFRYEPASLRGAPPVPHDRPDRREARAVVAFGTWLSEPSAEVFEAIMLGLDEAGVGDVRALVRDPRIRAQLIGSGHRDRVAERLNLLRELSTCDIYVSHGSPTSTLEALHLGAFPIALPLHNDNFFTARRCAEEGYGLTLDPATLDQDSVATTVRAVLHGSKPTSGVQAFRERNEALHGRELLVAWLERSVDRFAMGE